MNLVAHTDLDGRISQGWGGRKPNGVHVNVILARRGSPTAAAMITAFASPSPGFCPIGVPVGPDQPSYETVNPPIIMLNKNPVEGFAETLVFGAATVGTAQGVLDCVADGLLAADQETVVFVALWVDPAADDETAVKHAARDAVGAATREAACGRDRVATQRLVEGRDDLTHPFYGGR